MQTEVMDLLEQRAVFLGSSDNLHASDKVIIGLPMDATTSFRPGTRLAPYRIREVSEVIEEYSVYLDKSLADACYYDAGDVLIPWGNVNESLKRIEKVAHHFLSQDKRLFAIGGEHLVTLPLVKAYKEFYPDLAVIQMDAHADLRHDYLGEELSHATVMKRIVEQIGGKNLYQVGIRSGTLEEISFARQHTHFYLDRFIEVLDEVREKIKNQPVYISLDIDVLDPAHAPGTGTPEAGGVSSRELLQFLHGLQGLKVVGFDMVEISPSLDTGDVTSILGAKLLREALLTY